MNVPPEAFRNLATQYLNSNFPEPRRSTTVSDRVYQAHFKLSPLGTARLWCKLCQANEGNSYYQDPNDRDAQPVYFTNVLPRHLLWTLHYMKTYVSEDVASQLFGITCKTHRKYFWAIVHFLYVLASNKVSILILAYFTLF